MIQVRIRLVCPNSFGWLRAQAGQAYVWQQCTMSTKNIHNLKCFDSEALVPAKWYEIMSFFAKGHCGNMK